MQVFQNTLMIVLVSIALVAFTILKFQLRAGTLGSLTTMLSVQLFYLQYWFAVLSRSLMNCVRNLWLERTSSQFRSFVIRMLLWGTFSFLMIALTVWRARRLLSRKSTKINRP